MGTPFCKGRQFTLPNDQFRKGIFLMVRNLAISHHEETTFRKVDLGTLRNAKFHKVAFHLAKFGPFIFPPCEMPLKSPVLRRCWWYFTVSSPRYFAMLNIFCMSIWSQTLWSTTNMTVFLFCSWCCYFNSALAEKKKIDHPSSWAKLSQIGLSLMRWSYQCVISFWYHGVWEMMSWQCNAYSNSEDHKQMMA